MLKLFLKYALLVVALLFALLFVATMVEGYTGTVGRMVQLLNVEHYSEQIHALITVEKFRIVQTLLIVLVGVFVVWFAFFEPLFQRISAFAKDMVSSVFRVFKFGLAGNTKYILVIPMLAAVAFAHYHPVTYDEAWTYMNFTDRGILSSIGYYPAPNNHVLHSLLTNLTVHLPFLPPLMNLRISAIFFGVVTILFTAYFVNKHFNEQLALIVAGISATLPMSIYYGFISRGYGLVVLCLIVSLHFVFNILKSHHPKRDFVFFSLFSVIGFYTMPSYLYPYILLNVILLWKGFEHVKMQIISGLCTVVLVAVLYAPIVVLNGLKSLIGNAYVAPIDRFEVLQRLPSFLSSTIQSITGMHWFLVLFLIVGSVIYALSRRRKPFLHRELLLVFLIGPPVLLLVHSVIPFSRTFNYYGFIFIFLILLPFAPDLLRFKPKVVLIPVLVIQLAFVAYFGFNFKSDDGYNGVSTKMAAQILGDYDYAVNSNLFDAYLVYELKTRGFSDYTIQYYPSVEMDTDTMCADYVIIDREVDRTRTRKPVIENQFYRVIPAENCE